MSRVVRVYFNSTKKNFTVLTKESGKWRKSFSTDEITLYEVKFLCNHKSRLRVVATKQKFVHAYFQGEILNNDLRDKIGIPPLELDTIVADSPHTASEITYNPYLFPSFPEDGIGTQRYGEFCDRSIKDCFWNITNQKAGKCCDALRLRVIDKKAKLIAWNVQ